MFLTIKEDVMLAIEAWGLRRFKPMVMLAHVVASAAQECHELIHEARGPWLLSRGEALSIQPDPWLRLYRQPYALEAAVGQFVLAPDAPQHLAGAMDVWPGVRQQFFEALGEGVRRAVLGQVTREEIENAQGVIDFCYRFKHLPMMQRLLRGWGDPPANFRTWIAQPAFVFMMKVAMPCWLEYQTTPYELYREACRGDFVSLEKLMRLDPEIDKDDSLKVLVFKLRGANPAQYDLLQRAGLEGRKRKITLQNVKYALGGLLMKWSHELQGVLRGELWFEIVLDRTPPQQRRKVRTWIRKARAHAERYGSRCGLDTGDIRELFDAFAKDTGQGLIDEDFRGQPNSIYKRLDRNAKLWPSLRKTDIFRAA